MNLKIQILTVFVAIFDIPGLLTFFENLCLARIWAGGIFVYRTCSFFSAQIQLIACQIFDETGGQNIVI
jgi:hypothetical protein